MALEQLPLRGVMSVLAHMERWWYVVLPHIAERGTKALRLLCQQKAHLSNAPRENSELTGMMQTTVRS